jgi:hypothetical protein
MIELIDEYTTKVGMHDYLEREPETLWFSKPKAISYLTL